MRKGRKKKTYRTEEYNVTTKREEIDINKHNKNKYKHLRRVGGRVMNKICFN